MAHYTRNIKKRLLGNISKQAYVVARLAREPLLSLPFREVNPPRALHLSDKQAGFITDYARIWIGFGVQLSLSRIVSVADTLCN